MASTKKVKKLGEVYDYEKQEKARTKEVESVRSSFREDNDDRISALLSDARNIYQNERLRVTNNGEGESPYKNLNYIGANYKQEEKPQSKVDKLFSDAREIIDNRSWNYNIAEREYLNALPNDAYRNAYKASKETGGMYVSPYFSSGIEGKEKLKYNNDDWNNLTEAQRKAYLVWAQDDIKAGKNEASNNEYLNYAKKIIHEANGDMQVSNAIGNVMRYIGNTKVGQMLTHGSTNDLGSSTDTFDVDQETQIMFQMLPDDIREHLLDGWDLSENSKSRQLLRQYYSDEMIDKLIKYGHQVGNAYKQQKRNAAEEERMSNPFYASVVAPAKQIGLDLTVKPIAGAIDFYQSANELNKGIYGQYDPLSTEWQKMAQDARYINESINSGLGAGGRFVYGTAVSAAESTLRTYMATTGAHALTRTMPFINSEKAAQVLLTGMMSSAVFNDELNENIQKGMPLQDAMESAFAHSVFESLFEEISLDKLGYFQEAPVLRSKKDFLKQLVKAGFVEGTEEAATDIANELYDHYVGNYDFSEYKAFKDNYLLTHPDASDAEVWAQFTWKFSWQVAQSFAGGALSSFSLSSTKGMDALRRGETYVQNGKNVTDADYQKMLSFVTEMAAVNPSIKNQLEESAQGGIEAQKGFVKMVTDEYSDMFNRSIEEATSKDKLNVVMNNVNAALNGEISEETFNRYNAKLVELGEQPADYKTFVENRQKMGETTFTDLAYGTGNNAISRNIISASKSIAEARENAKLSESERESAIKAQQEKIEQNVKRAEEMVARYAQLGYAIDSKEVRQFESVLGLENMAQLYSAGKIAGENPVISSVTKPGVIAPIVKYSEEAKKVFKDDVEHIVEVPWNELKRSVAYDFAKVITRMTGANVVMYKSDREGIANGAYDSDTNTIFIDVNAGLTADNPAIGEVFSHELTHWIKAHNKAGYERLLAFVRDDLVGGVNEKGEALPDFDDLVKAKIANEKKFGNDMSVEDAQEEIVAQACQRMLQNSETFKRYAAQDPDGAKTLLQRLIDLVRKIRDAFKGTLGNRATSLINDLEGLQREWEAALNTAISDKDSPAVKSAMEGKENIVESVEKNADGNMTVAKLSDGKIMYSETTYRNGGRSAIVKALKDNGHTQEEIDKVTNYIDKHLEYIRALGIEFATKSFDKLAKNLDADITTDLATEAELLKKLEEGGISQEVINNLRSQNQIAYAYVSNGDYPMNIDLQLSCKKRIAYEAIINRMIETGLMADVRMSGEFIGEINTILAAHEFETQCLGCFVESRRLQMQKWAETFVAEWNQQVEKVTGKKRDKATKKDYLFHGENAAGTDDAFAAHLQLEEAIKSGERNRAGNGGIVLKERSVFNKMGELIAFNKKFYGKFLTVEDILTADGLKKLRALDNGNLFSLVKSRYGVASPKILQSFNPYNSEVLNLTFKSVSEMTGNSVSGAQNYIREAKKNFSAEELAEIRDIINKNFDGENLSKADFDKLMNEMVAKKVETDAIRQYLLDIGGNRIQSFSDFMIENVFDMLQIFADMSIRNYSMHGYTKEQICLRLFGMTGAKWNGSWISHNEAGMGKEASGLMPYTAENAKHGITVEVDGEKYVIQFDDYERHTRAKSFIQSIGFKDAIAIMLDPRYANNVGTITIGFSDKHIRAMLNSPYFRMIIPYHASGMIPGFAELVGASTYNDYTAYQTTSLNQILVYENGVAKVIKAKEVKEKEEEGVTKSSKGYKFSYKGNTYTVKPDMSFRFNEALQRTGDARAAAQEYVDWCRSEHPLKIDGIEAYATFNPAFSNSPYGYDFTQEYNYYKLLEDFNVYNSREEIINGVSVNARQEGVKLMYPGDEGGILSAAELKQYEADLKKTGLFSDAEIEKYVKKAQMTFDELVRGEVSSRNAYYENVFGKNNEKFDAAYEEIKQVSEKYKRNEQIADSKEQYLKSQEKAQKAKQNGNEKLLKAPAGTYLASVKYSLRDVDPVEPSTDSWKQTHDTEEAMRIAAEHGVKMWDVSADYSGVANATQMAASYTSDKMLGTTNTYKKVYEYLGKGYKGRVLDASSGMGYGTRLGRENYGLNVTDIEPYPHETRYQFLSDQDAYTEAGRDINVTNPRHPDYMDYEELDRLVQSGEVEPFDFIISNAVLNVLPQDLRDSLVQHMGDLLAENGRMFINVRKVDEIRKLANNPKNVKLGDHEAVESNNGNYQYGFSEPELIAYIQDALGDKFTVVDGRKAFGTSSPTVLVTKKAADAKYSRRKDILELKNIDWMGDDTSIKEQLVKHRDEVNEMDPIAEVVYYENGDNEIIKGIKDILPQIGGGNIKRMHNGDEITFSLDDVNIKQFVGHVTGINQRSAALIAPYVFKYGKLISGHRNHKNRNVTTLTFAAPAIINGVRVNVGAVIQFTGDGRPKSTDIDIDANGKMKNKKIPQDPGSAKGKSLVTYLPTGGINNTVAQDENVVKHSSRDSEYMTAVESGDMETAQRLVDEKAYKKNYIAAAWHGTPNGGFTEFGGTQTRNGAKAPGVIWFAEEKEHADVYRAYPGNWPKAENPQTYHVYLDVGEWADIGNGRVEALDYSRNGNGDASKDLKNVAKQIAYKTQWKHRNEPETARARRIANRLAEIARDIAADFVWQVTETTEFADLCKAEGLNSVVAWESHKGIFDEKPHMVKTWGVFEPSQIKSADPVVYDNNGDVIPLSERFDKDNNDIRYSSRDSEGNTLSPAQQKYFAESKVRNAEGNLLLVYHGSPSTDITSFDKSKAGQHTNAFNDKAIWFTNDENFAEDFSYEFLQGSSSYTYRRGNKGRVYSGYLNMVNPFDLTNPTDEMMAYINEKVGEAEAKKLLDIGNHQLIKMYLDASEIESMGYDGIIARIDTYERGGETEYGVFNSNQFKNADNLAPSESDDIRYSMRDVANSESEMLINALKNEEDRLEQFGAKKSVEAYAREYAKLKEMEKQSIEYSRALARKGTKPEEREDILKKQVRLDRAILNKTVELTEMRNQRVIRDLLIDEWEKRDTMIAAGRAEERLLTKKALEEKYGKDLASLKEKNRQQKQAIRDRHEINKRKDNIIKKTKALMDMIQHPTEKKHIPAILVNPIVDLLDGIDYWTPAEGRRVTKKSEKLRTRFEDFRYALKDYQEKIDEGAEEIVIMFPDDYIEDVEALCRSVKDIENVNDMNAEQITELDQVLSGLLRMISRGNKMIKAYHYQTVNEAVDVTNETLSKLPTLSGNISAKGSYRMRLNAGMADSYAFARYAGDGTKQIIDGLSKAFEDKISKVKAAVEFTQEVLAPYKKELKKWSTETHEFALSTTDGNGNNNKVKLTVAQMMELYLLNNREQARGHIYGGGIRVEDRKGRYTEAVEITEEDVNEIINYLQTVPGAIEVADKLQKYGATVITAWGNYASNLLYGFAKYTEENYWQIRSDKAGLPDNQSAEQSENASKYRIQNLGRTKATKKGASNAIYLGDVFDTWAKTIDEMTSYSSILPASTDAMRWWNSRTLGANGKMTSVKKLIESKLGTDMAKVFTDTIKAINGGIMGTDSLESLVKTLTGKAKAAAVAGNLRVVLQQPTAYTRAAAVIEPKYLLKALTMKPAAEEAQEHSPIAWHKAQGFYSNGLAPSLRKLVIGDGTFSENLTEKSLWLAGKADDITWGALWNAAKLKVEDTTTLKKGTDEYWNAVNEIFSDIINNTQVVDTPLTKSTWMRGNGLGIFFTAFMAEPTKTYSMVMTALEDAIRNPKSAEARKAFAGVATVFAVNAAVNAFAQALADAAREDDKEKDYWQKYVEKYIDDIKDNLNPLTYIPVVKDIWSMMNGYTNSNLALQAPQNTIYAIQEIQKISKGKSKKTLFGQIETIAKAVSSWTGIPVGNVMRTFNSFGNIAGVDIFRRKKYEKSELGRNVVLCIKEGNTEEAARYWAQLVSEVGEDNLSDAYGYISTYLAEHDENVDAYAAEFLNDPTTLERQAEDLMRKYEYSEYITLDVATAAIRKAARADQKAEAEASGEKYETTISSSSAAGTVYNSSDINRSLEEGKINEAQQIIDAINAGYKAKDSKDTAKKMVSDYWKEKYLAASGAERDQIARMLYKLRNNGKQMFSSSDLQKWVQDAKKKK